MSITHRQFYRAVAYCARRLQEELGGLFPPTTNDDGTVTKCSPVVLFLESNVGLLIHLLALMSLGVPVAVLSARLSPTAVQHLLSSIKAQSVITSPRLMSTIKEAIALDGQGQSVGIQLYIQRPYEDDLEDSQMLDLSATKNNDDRHFINENDRNVLILHSSGTTGLPKPIYQPHRYFLNFTECHQLGKEDIIGSVLSALPLFHVSF
jgi:acyl-CoA synthetase (AMP-forming)/AMP-acid ligase II